jgi:SnoaL-like domain
MTEVENETAPWSMLCTRLTWRATARACWRRWPMTWRCASSPQGTFHGVPAVRRFMQFSAGLLHHLDFRIRRTIVDGDAAVIWDESATTAAGKPRENHGVDVIRARNAKIVARSSLGPRCLPWRRERVDPRCALLPGE